MHIIEPLHSNRVAVLNSIDIVSTVTPADLARPTPCAGWDLGDLLTHMTAQHRGFAAAARGHGTDENAWDPAAISAAVQADPAGSYATAAHDVLDAFAADGIADATFALPEFGPGATAPGTVAIGFHLVDYVVHGWDVAATLGAPYTLPADVVAETLPLVLAIPDGATRDLPEIPFARAVNTAATTDLDRILAHLGRRPDWPQSN